jgi:hypothetical protein
MSSVPESTEEFVRQLLERRKRNEHLGRQVFPPVIREHDRQPPPPVNDSSYLYVRSYAGDIGERPITVRVATWLSPDVTVSPHNDLSAYTRLLEAGKTYQLACTVRNRGELGVPSAKVEFFLADPTLGFDTRFATRLGVASGWAGPGSSAKVTISYTVPPAAAGHKCLFVRTFSFSPVDLPLDDFRLDPITDRHVAQLNLDIVAQATTYGFQWVHAPQAEDTLQLAPVAREALLGMAHPALADFRIHDLAPQDDRLRGLRFEPDPRDQGLALDQQDAFTAKIAAQGQDGPDRVEQRTLAAALDEGLAAIRNGAEPSNFRETFARYRKSNAQVDRHRLNLTIPDLGLAKDEGVLLNIQSQNNFTGRIRGGITLLITG